MRQETATTAFIVLPALLLIATSTISTAAAKEPIPTPAPLATDAGIPVSAALQLYQEAAIPALDASEYDDTIVLSRSYPVDMTDLHIGFIDVSPMGALAPTKPNAARGQDEFGVFEEYGPTPFVWGAGRIVRF